MTTAPLLLTGPLPVPAYLYAHGAGPLTPVPGAGIPPYSPQTSPLHRPKPRAWGHTKRFLQRLYGSLLVLGYSHPDILAMSLRQAFIAMLGTDLAIDQSLGLGTYNGIKSPLSNVAQWRKVWSRIKNEQKVLYLAQVAIQEAALASLQASLEACKTAGIPAATILEAVMPTLKLNEWRTLPSVA